MRIGVAGLPESLLNGMRDGQLVASADAHVSMVPHPTQT